jgi:hypothetical protein
MCYLSIQRIKAFLRLSNKRDTQFGSGRIVEFSKQPSIFDHTMPGGLTRFHGSARNKERAAHPMVLRD